MSAARVYRNIYILLREGQFPGAAAGPLAEAQEFVTAMIANIEAAEKAAEAAPSDGQAEQA